MKTIIYMVRLLNHHTLKEPKEQEDSQLRVRDVEKVTEVLKEEGIDVIISSPYNRAILSIEGLAQNLGLDIKTFEDLRERYFAGEIIADLMSVIREKFYDFDYSLPGWESNSDCQNRSISVIKNILKEHSGKKIAKETRYL
jgi:2,3-bisphosphoglycerate-dependent phosphoglycerate mutase